MAILTDLLTHINFTEEDLEEIENALENLKKTIITKADEKKIPVPINFLKFGSIARKTKIKPLDDVDIIYIIGTAEKQLFSDMHIISRCSKDFGPEKKEPPENVSSVILLNDIKSAIKETYSTSSVRRNQEVVNIVLSSYGVGFDIVPAFYITNMDYFLIPQGGGQHQWKKTNPKLGEDIFIRANTKHMGHVRNTIKIIKYWFRKKKIVSPRNYHLECVICNAFNSLLFAKSTLKEALEFSFENINFNNYLYSCPDPTGLTEELNSYLSYTDITNIVEEAQKAKKLLADIPEFVKYVDEDI